MVDDAERHRVVDDGREGEQEQEAPVPPTIEDEACDQEQEVLPPHPQAVIERQHHGHEGEEGEAVEEHAGSLPGEEVGARSGRGHDGSEHAGGCLQRADDG